MERFVADNGTVVGTFTIADCAFAPVLWRWYRLPLSFDPWPKVARLRETVTARAAFREIGLVA
jgi:glutathione S-transferase